MAFGSRDDLILPRSPEPSDEFMKMAVYPIVVLGGGIGALTSSLYLARAGLQPQVIVGKNPGGLLTQSHTVQNWPGELEIDGTALTEKVRAQAEASGAIFQNEEVVGVDFSKRPYTITTRRLGEEKLHTIRAEAVIIAMGTQPNFLNVPGETGPDGYWGRGVTNCAICDGNLYRDQVVGVVGGGDAAVLEALYLSNIAAQVNVFVRKDALKAIEEKRVQTLLLKPNVKIHYHTAVQEIKGDGNKLTHVVLKTGEKDPSPFPLDGLFLAIGSRPNSDLFQGALKLDARGYIGLSKDQQTSIEGVYAIGDIVDPIYKQAISAAGDGAKAALQAQQYVSDRANGLIAQSKAVKPPKATPAINVIEVSSREQFERELKFSDVPVVVDFYANWCGPCKSLSPILESSANQLYGRVKFLKINVDKLGDLTSSYNIRAMPTVLIFDPSGAELERKVGMDQIADLLKRLETEK
jgi:thioredoxin reductase (NADPH)